MYKERVKENLETTRLRLRKFKLSDKEAVYKYGRDPRTLKYLEWIGVTTREEARISIEEYYLSRAGIYAIALKENDLCIGAIDIRLDEANDKARDVYKRQGNTQSYISIPRMAHSIRSIGLPTPIK